MAGLSGKNGQVLIDSVGGGGVEAILQVTGWKINSKADAVDTSGMASGGHRTYVAGMDDYTVSISAKWDTNETKQVGSPPEIIHGTAVNFQLYPSDSVVLYWDGTGIVTGYDLDSPYEGCLTWELSIQGSGLLTQPAANT